MTEFVAEYTTKDLILYALAVGFGADREDQQDELRYLFESHPSFSVVPSFPLVLPFWADRSNGSSATIKPFPPPMMKALGVLPSQFLRSKVELDELPVIHISQSITWHRPVPIPQATGDSSIQTDLSSRILSIVPKSVGAFVASETLVKVQGELMCTCRGTNLVLGIPPEEVIPYGKPLRKRQRNALEKKAPVFEWTFKTLPTQALLYRVASGDSNVIHVDSSAVFLLGASKRPLLHGLCTLGISIRGVMKYLRETGGNCHFTELEVDFTRPGLVGDCLTVRIWEGASQHQSKTEAKRILSFQVLNSDTGVIVIDNGVATVIQVKEANTVQTRAKL